MHCHSACANVNCRIMPGVPIEAVQEDLRRVLADDGVTGSACPVIVAWWLRYRA
jgi:hypothetical protein